MRPEVRAAMEPFLSQVYGNASGLPSVARRAKTALEAARESVAGALGCAPGEVVFTGGGTEADNLAVVRAARAARRVVGRVRVVATAFEHKAVLASVAELGREG